MLTASQTLNILVESGYISSWKKVTSTAYDLKFTGFDVKSSFVSVDDETYGRKSVLYFKANSPIDAEKMVNELRRNGGNPETDWNGGLEQGCFSMQVSYFKGYHWWE
jgi:hypothetical protein